MNQIEDWRSFQAISAKRQITSCDVKSFTVSHRFSHADGTQSQLFNFLRQLVAGAVLPSELTCGKVDSD
ncbi:MAG: hypothetical protein DMG13_05305 [Acidobacteria bacterium]|nr:MAG: hypothetical protein DMG13_05305 [Acidobacteriota bacterium]